jgi:uncharacterized membrane protein YsdA (DUF1294 family)/cold shock CspA family protein
VRTKGKITSWNDKKGYGFILPSAGGSRTFLHIKALSDRARRPLVGDIVTYSLSTDARGRHCAGAVTIVDASGKTRSKPAVDVVSRIAALGFLLLVGSAVLVSAIPLPVLVVYVVVSVVTFSAYAFDKAAAKKGYWRTSENTLHLLALVGGWPGALLAQGYLRHKTRKQPFRAIFWVTVLLNCCVLGWLFTPNGANAWRSMVTAVV